MASATPPLPPPSPLPSIPSSPSCPCSRKSVKWAYPLTHNLSPSTISKSKTSLTNSKTLKFPKVAHSFTPSSLNRTPAAHEAHPCNHRSIQFPLCQPADIDDGWTLVSYKKRRKPLAIPPHKPSHPWFDSTLKGKPHLQKCFRCGIKGHKISTCTNKMACLYCQLDDHTAATCPFLHPQPPEPQYQNRAPPPTLQDSSRLARRHREPRHHRPQQPQSRFRSNRHPPSSIHHPG